MEHRKTPPVLLVSAFASVILSGAIFGFFYAWVCSTMWGLDAIDPRTAIEAMQGMNASVRNIVFAPAFFGTPIVLGVTALLAVAHRHHAAGQSFAAAGLIYGAGGLVLTVSLNVPMNEALAQVVVPQDIDAARDIWQAYSTDWQFWNVLRSLAAALTLGLAGAGLWLLGGQGA